MRVRKRTNLHKLPGSHLRHANVKTTNVNASTKGKLYFKQKTRETQTINHGPRVEYDMKSRSGLGVRADYSDKTRSVTNHQVNVKKAGGMALAGAAAYQGIKYARHRSATGKSDVASSANSRTTTTKTKTFGRVGRKR